MDISLNLIVERSREPVTFTLYFFMLPILSKQNFCNEENELFEIPKTRVHLK